MATGISARTRDNLLSAAERLLLTRGYDDVSVRAICTEAQVNPASVHYHFGSKDALVMALLEDRLGPVWAARLDSAAASHSDIPELIDAVIEPFVELAADPIGRLHLSLLSQFVLGRHMSSGKQPWFRLDSWSGLLPQLDEQEARSRWMLAFDLLIARFGGVGVEEPGMSGQSLASLRTFVIAGLTAPTATTP